LRGIVSPALDPGVRLHLLKAKFQEDLAVFLPQLLQRVQVAPDEGRRRAIAIEGSKYLILMHEKARSEWRYPLDKMALKYITKN
jgi:hypothetical protein